MSNLENNELLETIDTSVSASLGASSIKSIELFTFDAIIHHLSAMESISANSLKYLNSVYTKTFKFDDKTIAEIEKLEEKIFLLESKILEIISKDDTCKDKYDEYLSLHRSFMSDALFSDNRNVIIQNVLSMNTILEQIDAVSDLAKKRKEAFDALAKLDGFKDTNENAIVLRYKRIFLQRRHFLYSIINTKLVVGESFERTDSNRDDLAYLLNNQDDFAIYRFQALLKPVSVEEKAPGAAAFTFDLTTLTDETLSLESELERKLKSLEILKNKIEEEGEKIGNFEEIMNEPTVDTNEKLKDIKQLREIYLNEQSALVILQSLNELKKQGEKPKKDPEVERKQKIKEEWGKYIYQETGAAVGKLLYMAIKGDEKSVGKLVESTLTNLTKKSAILFAQFISGPFAPFVGPLVDGFFGALFEKEKEDPILKGIDEVKEKLEKIEGKINNLQTQIEAFQKEMKRMIDNIPKAVISEVEASNLKTVIDKLLLDISTKLLNIKRLSEKIIKNDKDVIFKTEDLINHSEQVLRLIQDLISNIYGLTLLDIEEYKIADKPSDTSFFGWHLKEAKSEHFQFDFNTQYGTLSNVLKNLKENVFDKYCGFQVTINEALAICYSKGGSEQQCIEIVDFLTKQEIVKAKLKVMFDNIASRLESKMLGDNNDYLFQNLESYKDKHSQFNFTKAFGLQISSIKDGIESWNYCTYNYKTKLFETIQTVSGNQDEPKKIGHISRFLINPGFGRTYNLFCSNDDCVQELINAKVCLGLDDSISITTIEGDKRNQTQTFRVVPLTASAFDDSVDMLFATNGHIVVQDSVKKSIRMPLKNYQLFVESNSNDVRVGLLKDKEGASDYTTILFEEKIDPNKYTGGVILKFDNANLCCSLGTLDTDGNVSPDTAAVEVFSFNPKKGLVINELHAINWELHSSKGNPISIDSRYLVSYLNKSSYVGETYTSILEAGQALYKNEELISERYKMRYTNDGYFTYYAYNNIGKTYEEYFSKRTNFHKDAEVLVMQGDGCLVGYDKNGKNIWKNDVKANLLHMMRVIPGFAPANNIDQPFYVCFDGVPNSKPQLKPAEYLKRGEDLHYRREVLGYNPYTEETLFKLTYDGDLEIRTDNKEIHDLEKERDSLTGLKAHFLKMGVDGALALYDDKKNILIQMDAAGRREVKCCLVEVAAGGYQPNFIKVGFVENSDTPSFPILDFWINEMYVTES